MTPNPFSSKLRDLRGAMSVEELAKLAAVSPASIYKMESTSKVRWQTVERAYGRFFEDRQEMCQTLVLWALEQTGVGLDPEVLTASCVEAVTTGEAIRESHAAGLAQVFARLTTEDARLLADFAERFSLNEPTRQMVRAWLATTRV